MDAGSQEPGPFSTALPSQNQGAGLGVGQLHGMPAQADAGLVYFAISLAPRSSFKNVFFPFYLKVRDRSWHIDSIV